MQFCITLFISAGVSLRSVSKVLINMNIYLRVNLACPSHTTVLNWVKKQGISNLMDNTICGQEKLVLIVDESIQFGNKKLLLILAVKESRCCQNKALSYGDLIPLVLKVNASWKADDISAEIRRQIDLKQIAYCISDNGSNLTCAFNSRLLSLRSVSLSNCGQ